MDTPTRRRLLGLVGGGGLVTVAGCNESSEGDEGGPTATSAKQTTTEGDTPTDRRTEADGTATPELDLREANVVGVAVESTDDDQYRFDVALYHDDDGEDGYADWWQVETLDGEQLGRRELLHAHSTAPFTRSETVSIPDSVSCVVVRGHDQTHGYGGQAMLVGLPDGATSPRQQGGDRREFTVEACP
ncbi:hypothetical protein [Haloarcula montana]|uniref:hypothetical protein n=1 Tax=Haloarcula montana TaxID=3111776 RepID=UPI002D78CD17|nr:hypothetical protein [Haloarcula sp. GH36]